MKPLVCIAILNYNGLEVTKNCLKSLKITSYPNYKIILLDNGSTDNSYKELKKINGIKLIKSEKNLGYTKGMNYLWSIILKKYNPDYICNMNNDIITIQPKWLDLMVESLEKNKKNGICGNKLLFPDGRLQLLYTDRNPKEFTEMDKGQYDFEKKVSAVGGANMLIKKEVINSFGGLDENFFFGPDDIDYCLRTNKKYNIIYNGHSKSIHLGSFSYNSSKKDFIYKHQAYGMIIFSLRHHKNKLKMIFNQFIRIFFTRKDPYKKIKINNIYFHKNILLRMKYFILATIKGLQNYNKIKVSEKL